MPEADGKSQPAKPKLTELFRTMVGGLRQAADALETIAQRIEALSNRFEEIEGEAEDANGANGTP